MFWDEEKDEKIRKILETAAQATKIYTTPLISPAPNIDETLLGSGTFIIIGHKKGILTNAHVSLDLVESKKIGHVNILGHNENLQPLSFEVIIKLPPKENNLGLDLAFIVLNPDQYNIINQLGKSFFDLNAQLSNIESMLNPQSNIISWPIHANIDYKKRITYIDRPIVDYKNSGTYFGEPDLKNIESGLCNYDSLTFPYDIITCPIETKDATPAKFYGTSGAALWQVIFDTNCNIQQINLFGVATEFCPPEKAKFLKCRGPLSIYKSFYPFCIKHFSRKLNED